MSVDGSVILKKLSATALVDLNGAQISGQLDCSGATFDGQEKIPGKVNVAFDARRTAVKQGFIWRNVTTVQGTIGVNAMQVGALVDDLASWPDHVILDGFVYDRLAFAPTDATERLRWLRKGAVRNGAFLPQIYTQLAKALTQDGHDRAARAIRMAAKQDAAAHDRTVARSPLAISWSWVADIFMRWVVGYGYAPWRAFASLTILWTVATFIAALVWTEGSFAPNSDVILVSSGWSVAMSKECLGILPSAISVCDNNPAKTWSSIPMVGVDWDTFNAAAYGLDLVVPVLDLGQTSAWAPSKDRGPRGRGLWWGRWWFEVLGWVVTALGAAAITGIIQRDRG